MSGDIQLLILCIPHHWVNIVLLFPSPHGSTASSVLPSTVEPPPMADDNSPFKLHFISGNIAKCAGCGNKYVKPALPPYDLCREWRFFTASGAQQSKFSPAYYHVNVLCIKKNWPSFSPQHVVITSDVYMKHHKSKIFWHVSNYVTDFFPKFIIYIRF